MCNPIDAVCNMLDALQPSLIAQIDLAIDFIGADERTFYEPLEKPDWVNMEPYKEMVLSYAGAEMTFSSMCEHFWLASPPIGRQLAESEFAAELRNQVKDHVDARLTYWREKQMQERSLEWNWKRDREIKQGAVI